MFYFLFFILYYNSITGRTNFGKLPQNASNPGPGSYEANNYKKVNNPVYGFGSAKKEFIYETALKKTKLLPGPANYNQETKTLARSNSLISFGKEKKLNQKISSTPGPGNYNLDKTNKNIKNIGLDKSKRNIGEFFVQKLNKSPGPANYKNIDSFACRPNTAFVKFSKGERMKKVNNNQNPGPGYYDI